MVGKVALTASVSVVTAVPSALAKLNEMMTGVLAWVVIKEFKVDNDLGSTVVTAASVIPAAAAKAPLGRITFLTYGKSTPPDYKAGGLKVKSAVRPVAANLLEEMAIPSP